MMGEETCRLSFRVFRDSEKKRWFIPNRQAGCCDHVGHPRVEPSQVRVVSKTIGRDSVRLSQQHFEEQIMSAATAAVINNRTNIELEDYQLQHIQKKAAEESLRMSIRVLQEQGELTADPSYVFSAADKLLVTCGTQSKL